MGNKKKMKPGTNELIRRTDLLLSEIHKLKGLSEYLHRLISEYINFEGNESKFKKYLKEKMNAGTEKNGQLQKSTNTDSSTKRRKQKVKKPARKKTKTTKDTGESGAIGL